MTLRAVLLLSLLMFSLGWYGGLRYARETAASAPAPTQPAAAGVADGNVMPATPVPSTAPSNSVAGVAATVVNEAAKPDAAAPEKQSSAGSLSPEAMEAIRKMTERMVLQQAAEFPAQKRSEPWATEREAKLRATVEPMFANFPGARIVSIDCRTTLCQFQADAPDWATELTGFTAEPGTLLHAVRGAGFDVEMANNAPDKANGVVHLTWTMRTAQDSAPAAAPGR